MKKIKSSVKGITLIALVVTIIVLLILAGVAIGLGIGDNGIITGAENAAEKWKEGQSNEQEELGDLSEFITTTTEGKKVSSVLGGEKFEKTETIKDDNGKEVTIPKGFGVAEDSNTVVDEGIIITDGTNEFVWVPADDSSTMFIEESAQLYGVTTKTNIYSKLRIRTEDSFIAAGKPGDFSGNKREPDLLSTFDRDEKNYNTVLSFNSIQEMADSMVEEYKAMSDSVKKYRGFYIGRYELTGNIDNPTEKSGKPIEGNWYNIYKASQNVIKNNEEVKSTMIYGCQWDEVCDWLSKNGYNINSDSSSWGNFGDDDINTGSNSKYKANEIYDLAGNNEEWTQEASSTGTRVTRGGNWSWTRIE